ncbi:unnamed protein product [Echinostoma caproni]|uniref:Uncharacterized protein n=1 Tax=Echinostoma caproni TaxID=27848 RepID=A0A183B183_9TREM|nr:unnamed protein product [Echinostoma caproni]
MVHDNVLCTISVKVSPLSVTEVYSAFFSAFTHWGNLPCFASYNALGALGSHFWMNIFRTFRSSSASLSSIQVCSAQTSKQNMSNTKFPKLINCPFHSVKVKVSPCTDHLTDLSSWRAYSLLCRSTRLRSVFTAACKWIHECYKTPSSLITFQFVCDKTFDGPLFLTTFHSHRPIISYALCAIYLVVFCLSLLFTSLAPIGFVERRVVTTTRVPMPNLTTTYQLCWRDQTNLWVGPRPIDLIRFGASYAPCMREQIEQEKSISGCCILADGRACFQSTRDSCPQSFSMWLRGNNMEAHRHKVSEKSIQYSTAQEETTEQQNRKNAGPICGLDPEFCLQPSPDDERWSTADVTQWPRPKHEVLMATPLHMRCNVIGHPCCRGARGRCMITTREHCAAIRGTYHPEAALCSQVECYPCYHLLIHRIKHDTFLTGNSHSTFSLYICGCVCAMHEPKCNNKPLSALHAWIPTVTE